MSLIGEMGDEYEGEGVSWHRRFKIRGSGTIWELVPITSCPHVRRQSAYLASILLEALGNGDECMLESALQLSRELHAGGEELDPASAERLELLDAVAADMQASGGVEVHAKLLRHLAQALLETQKGFELL